MADFRQDQYNKYYTKLEKYRKKLPSFVNEYIVSLATKSIETQSDYCYNIVQFFEYFVQNNPALNGKLTNKVSKDAVNQLRPQDINEYIAYLINERRYATASVQKTVTVLNCLFSFLEDSELIDKNPMRKSMKPRTKEQLDIVHLPRKDMDELQDVVATGKNLTRHRKSYHEKTRLRDEAIVTLFLKTGIRVSECAGIRMCDVDFEKPEIAGLFSEHMPYFANAMREATGLPVSFRYGTDASIAVDDFYEEKDVDFAVTKEQDPIATKVLYGIARSFVEEMGELLS